MMIVQHEMKWTILWFKNQVKVWSIRLSESRRLDEAGKKAYAEKQVAIWNSFVQDAEYNFKGKAIL